MDAEATGSSFVSTLGRRRCEAIGAGSGTLRQLDTLSPVVGLPRQCPDPAVPLRPGRFAMHEARFYHSTDSSLFLSTALNSSR